MGSPLQLVSPAPCRRPRWEIVRLLCIPTYIWGFTLQAHAGNKVCRGGCSARSFFQRMAASSAHPSQQAQADEPEFLGREGRSCWRGSLRARDFGFRLAWPHLLQGSTRSPETALLDLFDPCIIHIIYMYIYRYIHSNI